MTTWNKGDRSQGLGLTKGKESAQGRESNGRSPDIKLDESEVNSFYIPPPTECKVS